MSAFIVSTKTIDHVIDAIQVKTSHGITNGQAIDDGRLDAWGECFGVSFRDPDASSWPWLTDWESDLGELLWSLNHEAVEVERYPHHSEEQSGLTMRYRYRKRMPIFHPIYNGEDSRDGMAMIPQLVKSIQCLRYQCLEGDIAIHPALGLLDSLGQSLVTFWFEQREEYDKAEWCA